MRFQRDTKFQKTKKPAFRFSRKSASQESDSNFRKADSQKCESAFLFVGRGPPQVATEAGQSNDEHAIAVAEKPILLAHGLLIRPENIFATRHGAHQHNQRRFRKVEVRKQRIDPVK